MAKSNGAGKQGAGKREQGTVSMRREGGYVPGGRPQGQPSTGPRLTDIAGPKDPVELNAGNYDPGSKGGKRMKVESFKSTENQANTSMAGVADRSSGPIQQLRRSVPNAGVFQSGNNDRGGTATRGYDTEVDADIQIVPSWLEEIRAHQDKAAARGSRATQDHAEQQTHEESQDNIAEHSGGDQRWDD